MPGMRLLDGQNATRGVMLFTLLAFTVASSAEYRRPPPSLDLDFEHPLLKKRSDKPHEPEQIHLALAGPGRVAVSWVTRPQVLLRLHKQPICMLDA